MQFAAGQDAPERVRSARVDSRAGHLSGSEPIVIRDLAVKTGSCLKDHRQSGSLRTIAAGIVWWSADRVQQERLARRVRRHPRVGGSGTPRTQLAGRTPGLGWPLVPEELCRNQLDLRLLHGIRKEVVDSDTAGTGFGLLPFLGAGIAHNQHRKARRSWRSTRKQSRTALPICCETRSKRETHRRSVTWEETSTLTLSPRWPCAKPTACRATSG